MVTSSCQTIAHIWSTLVSLVESGYRPIQAWRQTLHYRHWFLLKKEKIESVIEAMKKIFARHGILMESIVCYNNGPCYFSAQFKQFALNYGFILTTSSPCFAQANSEAERGLRAAKDASHLIRIFLLTDRRH